MARSTIHFMWSKAHIGVGDNEIVDKLAKFEVDNGQEYISYIPTSDILAEIKNEMGD